jgi:hypothetical protein
VKYDEVAVERLLAGTMRVGDAHVDDRNAAILHLVDAGATPITAADQLKVNFATVRKVIAVREAKRAHRAARMAAAE